MLMLARMPVAVAVVLILISIAIAVFRPPGAVMCDACMSVPLIQGGPPGTEGPEEAN